MKVGVKSLKFPEVVIIIINYNQIGHTLECINSLIDAGAGLTQIIVVDNASQDKSVDILRDHFGKSITILELKENKGYPHGLNSGIPVAIDKGADWLLLMNNDVIVDKNFLIELRIATIKHPEANLIGPAILYYDQPDLIWYVGYKLIPGTLIGVRSFRGRHYSSKIPGYVSIDVMHGCTMMVNKLVFKEIGLFDDTNLIYGDDADFSLRAREAGFKMIAATRAKMWHKISLTMGKEKPRTRYLRTRNTIAFYNKHSHGLKKLIMFVFTISKGFIILISDIFRWHIYLVPPLLFGIIDGWANPQKDIRPFK